VTLFQFYHYSNAHVRTLNFKNIKGLDMDDYKSKFLKAFKKLLTDMRKFEDSKSIEKMLKVFDKLDTKKLAAKYYEKMKEYSDDIMNLNLKMYDNDVQLPSGIKLSKFMNNLPDDKLQHKYMSYVKLIFILSEIINKESNIVQSESNASESQEFNPYEGIGGDKEFGVDEMFNGVDELKVEGTPGFGSLAKLVGIDKMMDLDKLTEELQNMDEEQVSNATENIKNMMGGNIDDKTSQTITNMLNSISSELKNKDLKNGNIFDNLSDIASIVANKMKPDVENGNVDVKSLWESTRKLASKCKSDVEDELGANGINPLDLLSDMVGKEFDKPDQNLNK